MSIAIAITLIAFPALGFILLPFWRRPATTESELGFREEAQELLEIKHTLYRAMKELEFDYQAGHLSDEDYERLRASYEGRAAQALKALDQLGVKPDISEKPQHRRMTRSTQSQSLSWGRRPVVLVLGAVVFVGFGLSLGMLLAKSTAPESLGTAGETGAPTSGPTLGARSQEGGARSIPPEMLRGMLDAAHQSLDAGRFQEAIAAYKAVLARSPRNVEAITHLGIILGIAGHTDAALEALEKALAIDPTYPHALWDKGRLLHEAKQDDAGAIRAWERFAQVAPPGADQDRAQQLIQEAKRRLLQKK